MNEMAVEFQAREVLKELILEGQEKLPFSLKVPDLKELLNASEWSVYEKLRRGEIPGARKIPGIGWRVNRDIFLTWLYSK